MHEEFSELEFAFQLRKREKFARAYVSFLSFSLSEKKPAITSYREYESPPPFPPPMAVAWYRFV